MEATRVRVRGGQREREESDVEETFPVMLTRSCGQIRTEHEIQISQ